MPKEWNQYKAVIEQLYMVDQMSLKEVRAILIDQHHFNASTRAYRMKLDSWGFRKNNSSKGTQIRERRSPARSSPNLALIDLCHSLPPAGSTDCVIMSPSTTDYWENSLGIKHAPRSKAFVKILDLISSGQLRHEGVDCLELIVSGWETDEDYLNDALSFSRALCGFINLSASTTRHDLPIFELVATKLPEHQGYKLVKACLESDLNAQRRRPANYPSIDNRLRNWWDACIPSSWKEAKTLLRDDAASSCELFLNCALAVIAEYLLQEYKQSLEPWAIRGDTLDSEDLDYVEVCCQSYMTILKDFCHAKFDLDPSWYRYFVHVNELNRAIESSKQERLEKSLERKESRYNEVEALYRGLSKRLGDLKDQTTLPRAIEPEHKPIYPLSHHLQLRSNLPGPPDVDKFMPEFYPISSEEHILKFLYRQWTSNSGLDLTLISLLENDGITRSIFQRSATGTKNLFDTIELFIPRTVRLSFTIAILDTLTRSSNPVKSRHHHLYASWYSFTLSTGWASHKWYKSINSIEVNEALMKCMSHEAVILLNAATTILVGERILKKLRSQLAQDPYGDPKTHQEYIEITQDLIKAELEVDESCQHFVRNIAVPFTDD